MQIQFVINAILFLIPSIPLGMTINVPSDYNTIQEAINASKNGDIIIVDAGTYIENIDFRGKAITLKSSFGPENTTIDGNQKRSVVSFQNGEETDSILAGFTVTNGSGNWLPVSHFVGGGIFIYNCSPSIVDCWILSNDCERGGGICLYEANCSAQIIYSRISNNSALRGGGIFCHKSSPLIEECVIIDNSARQFGGGIDVFLGGHAIINNNLIDNNSGGNRGGGINGSASPVLTIINNTISNNNAQDGGGVFLYNGTIKHNDIINNVANNPYSNYGSGGGVFLACNTTISVTNNIISHNISSGVGGGIYSGGISIVANNNIFYNQAFEWSSQGGMGGGIYASNFTSGFTVVNCFVYNNAADNYGGGIAFDFKSSGTIKNCTFFNNYSQLGKGIYIREYTPVTIENSILWDDPNDEIYYLNTKPSVAFSDIAGGWIGSGNIDSDPLFVYPSNGDFHLTFNSPCRGSGDNTAVTELFDFEGDQRIAYGTVDMGADEFYTHLYVTGDKTPGGSIQGKFIGLPGTTPVGLFIGSGVLPSPMPTMWGEYWLQAPWILLGPLGAIPADGVMVLPTTLHVSIPAPYDVPMQALIGLNTDSMTNLEILEIR